MSMYNFKKSIKTDYNIHYKSTSINLIKKALIRTIHILLSTFYFYTLYIGLLHLLSIFYLILIVSS